MKTPKPTKKPGAWSAAPNLATWDKPALLALVKDLYDAAAGNRNFIHARCQAGDGSGGEVLETYRSKIVEQFFSKRGIGKLKLAEARKAIRDYKKATGNIPGTAELLMTYVENGVRVYRRIWGHRRAILQQRGVGAGRTGRPCCAARRGSVSTVPRDSGGSGTDDRRHRLGIPRFHRRCGLAT